MTENKINNYWDKLSGDERIALMKKASGLPSPSAVKYWNHPPEAVTRYLQERIEELQEMEQEYILNHSDIGQRSVSWGELADMQAEAESLWNETDEGKELKALLNEQEN